MFRWLALAVTASALWFGYWFYASSRLETGLETFLEERAQAGWQVSYDNLNVRGFPNRLDSRLDNVTLGSGDTGVTWTAPFFQLFALSYRPNQIIAVWPQAQSLDLPGIGTVEIASEDMRASALLRPEADLPLDHATFIARGLTLSRPEAAVTMGELRLASRLAGAGDTRHEIGIEALGLQLEGPGLPKVLGEENGRLRIDAFADLDGPLDRQIASGRPPAITGLELRSLTASWAGMQLSGEGRLAPGPDGRAEGKLTLRIEGWDKALTLAQDSGWITADDAARMRQVLGGMAAADGAVSLPLSLAKGRMRLAVLDLGPAPLLRW